MTIILARKQFACRSITLELEMLPSWRHRVAHGDMKRSKLRRLRTITRDQVRKLKAA